MDSDVADISQVNAGMDRAGHMLQGGVFLREFVAEGCRGRTSTSPGPAYHSGEPTGYWTKGGTGVPVRTPARRCVERPSRRQRRERCERRARRPHSPEAPASAGLLRAL